ncbi:acyl-CoA dehydrogenase family protein [Amycolatopsis jejuensis]|uniref:acyl-CoA dehydrogenase family protein n=1 Tax=Amycolatopsis jejuensis TaxID=330084 RepID=UPI000690C62D|nr:acyl-CoA dehydrogenase family protein [Amycolatopsis jejuensis]
MSTAEEVEAFRDDLRTWLSANRPPPAPPSHDGAARIAHSKAWHRQLSAGGWLGLSWPAEYGGQERPPVFEAILNDELGAAGAPLLTSFSYLGRVLLTSGTEEQQRRYLPPMLAGTEFWCQGFSEPEAGSDLASLSTAARRDGGEWVVNGRKIWTSRAHHAEFCLLLCRTEPGSDRNRGLSFLVVPTSAPGVTIRQFALSTGAEEFAEVFFDDARVPVGNLVGTEGEAWPVAMAALEYERGPGDVGFVGILGHDLALMEQAGADVTDSFVRARIGRAYVLTEAVRRVCATSMAARLAGQPPGPEISVDKLFFTRARQEISRDFTDLVPGAQAGSEGKALRDYLYSRAVSVFGGTEQIQRNIVAQRVLGMPR